MFLYGLATALPNVVKGAYQVPQKHVRCQSHFHVCHCLGMLGSGRASVAEVADMARSTLADGLPPKAVEAFASLDSGGVHANNQERDLHRWLHSLFGMTLMTFKVPMALNVS